MSEGLRKSINEKSKRKKIFFLILMSRVPETNRFSYLQRKAYGNILNTVSSDGFKHFFKNLAILKVRIATLFFLPGLQYI